MVLASLVCREMEAGTPKSACSGDDWCRAVRLPPFPGLLGSSLDFFKENKHGQAVR